MDISTRGLEVQMADGTRHLVVVEIAMPEGVGDCDRYEIALIHSGRRFVGASSHSMFSALTELRRQLEAEDMLLVCFGASEHVYPSGMSLGSGDGDLAYKLELGRHATRRDLVHILDTDDGVRPATIAEQEKFRDLWYASDKPLTQHHTIKFYRTGDAYGYMSNFAPYPIMLANKLWPTAEHYFQAMKFIDPNYAEAIRLTSSPMQAARLGRSRENALRPDWETIKDNVMVEAVLAKFSQHLDIREQLIATGDARLVEHTESDRYWADGGDGSGQNRLGLILMQVRELLRNQP